MIEEAIVRETVASIEKYGPNYASKHEAYSILKEEVEEAKEAMDKFRPTMHIFWKSVRGLAVDNVQNYTDRKHIIYMKKLAIELAHEAVQIAAVCQKIIESIDAGKIE